jgi:hypothetical protein
MTIEEMNKRADDLRMRDAEFKKMKDRHELDQQIFCLRLSLAMNASLIVEAAPIQGSMLA